MLAVFNKSIAAIPHAMRNPESTPISASKDYFLAHKLIEFYPHATTIKFGEPGYLAIDDRPERRFIEAHEDVFCLFYGNIEDTVKLKEYLKLTESASDAHVIIELYKMWKKEKAHIVDSPLSEAEGSFAFILYDMTCDYVAIGIDAEGNMPLYWGADADGNFVVSSFLPLVKCCCSRSYAPFPAGCLYTTSNGLMNFKHPSSLLEFVPWSDNKGKTCGVIFRTKFKVEGRYHSMCWYPEPKQ